MADGEFRILFVADVVGHPGRDAVRALLPPLKKELRPHLTILNGENAAGGFGLTAKIAAELKGAGADVITSGNHVFAQKEFVGELPNLERVLRPANYPPAAPGQGWCVMDVGGHQVLVMNLIGRIFLDPLDDPFRAADAILAAHSATCTPRRRRRRRRWGGTWTAGRAQWWALTLIFPPPTAGFCRPGRPTSPTWAWSGPGTAASGWTRTSSSSAS